MAEHAGVSLATASRTLNGSSRVVDPALATRVRASALLLHYTVNAHAQATARGTTHTVAIMVGDIEDAYFSAIASGVLQAADETGLTVSLGIAGSAHDRTIDLLTAVRGQRPRALLVATSRTAGDERDDAIVAAYSAIAAGGTRVAFVGSPMPGYRGVDVRNRHGAERLAGELHGLGYGDFAVLAGPPDLVTATERTTGFLAQVARLGDEVSGSRVVHGALTRSGGFDAMNRILDDGPRPDAVFAVTDAMAIGAMLALRERGIEPGREIGVAGFDDIPPARDVMPQLSTVRLPLQQIGRRVLDLALVEPAPDPAHTDTDTDTDTDDDHDHDDDHVEGVVVLRGSTPHRG